MSGVRKMASAPLPVHFPSCGVYVIESHHADDFRMDVTRCGYAKLFFALAGQGRIEEEGQSLFLQAGCTALIPPGVRHRLLDEEPLALYILCVRPEILPGNEKDWGRGGALIHPGLRNLAGSAFREMLYEQSIRPPGWEFVLSGVAQQLLGAWFRAKAHHHAGSAETSHQRVRFQLAEMEQTFYRRESLADAARRCGLGVRRFSQIFRKLTGSSWLAYVRAKRIAHARRLLQTTNRSVLSICYECGFEDFSNFYRAFQQATKMSPQRWREKAAQEEAAASVARKKGRPG